MQITHNYECLDCQKSYQYEWQNVSPHSVEDSKCPHCGSRRRQHMGGLIDKKFGDRYRTGIPQ